MLESSLPKYDVGATQKCEADLKITGGSSPTLRCWQNISWGEQESHLGGSAHWGVGDPVATTLTPGPAPRRRCPLQIHLINVTLSRSATRNLRENSPLFSPDSCPGPKVELKHMWEVTKAPHPPGPRSASVQEGGHRPPTDLPSDSDYNLCHIFSEFRRTFSELEERPTASSQSLGSLGSHLLSKKIPEEQSWMPQVPTPILKSDKTAG